MAQQLLIASTNLGKVAEFRDLLAGSGFEVVAPQDLDLALDVPETDASGRLKESVRAISGRLRAAPTVSGTILSFCCRPWARQWLSCPRRRRTASATARGRSPGSVRTWSGYASVARSVGRAPANGIS